MDIKFINASEKDYDFCHNLSKENIYDLVVKYWGSWDSDMYRKDFNAKETKIIILENKPIGFFRIRIEEDCVYIIDMQLEKRFQGKGYGKKMLAEIDKIAIDNKFAKIKLSVFKDNLARKLYEKMGFALIDTKNFALEYEKNL